ncbi:hypothetical protein M0804_009807 [Polistes exclamans]|nr:hypothetical protein M0804_009807 [Polistes exclamans]
MVWGIWKRGMRNAIEDRESAGQRQITYEEESWESKRTLKYIKEMLKMGETKWPKICVMEEIRAVTNVKVLREMGIEEMIEMIRKRKEVVRIKDKIKEGLKELQRERGEEEKIRKTTYNSINKCV